MKEDFWNDETAVICIIYFISSRNDNSMWYWWISDDKSMEWIFKIIYSYLNLLFLNAILKYYDLYIVKLEWEK